MNSSSSSSHLSKVNKTHSKDPTDFVTFSLKHFVTCSLKIKAIHTPGHTAGGNSLLVEKNNDHNEDYYNHQSNDGNSRNEISSSMVYRLPILLFTGDVLFVNGIGRPDLRDKAQEFAELLYNTRL